MSNEDLPSITSRTDESGDERSSVNTEKESALFAQAIDAIIQATRIENGELNNIDLESMIEKTEEMGLSKKKDVKIKKVHLIHKSLDIICNKQKHYQ